jgi:hypothetical protein
MARPVKVFVAASGNAFMTDIAGWIAEAAEQCGHRAKIVTDALPTADGNINLVVAPHEFYPLRDDDDHAVRAAAAASVPVCTEQPGTPWYHLSLGFCRPSAMALDINAHGVEALRSDGVHARHLRLGGVPSMSRPTAQRDIEVLFLGGLTDRRGAVLAEMAPLLASRAAELRTFRFTRPVRGRVPGLVFGDEKYRLLGRSKILLNVHRDDTRPGYFEWARMVEAMANGCVVLTEPSTDFEPLVEQEDFVSTDDLTGTLSDLLDDSARIARVGAAASHAVLAQHPLQATLGPLLDEIDRCPPPPAPKRRAFGLRGPAPLIREHRPPLLPPLRPADQLRERTYLAMMAEQELQRDIQRQRCVLAHGTDDHIVRRESAAYAVARPEVSVIVTLFNYADVVRETLDSVLASTGVDFEMVIVDDHSTDNGRAVVTDYLDQHPQAPMVLLGRETNRGLSPARNLAIECARGRKIMVVDADNHLYPRCLKTLSDVLDSAPDAAFAYGTLEDFGVAPGMRSAMGWHVPWVCERNYIDAQAMIRADVFARYGGYRTEGTWVYGWEDWELWLRLAAAGEHGVHHPNFVGRYRTQPSSMVAVTNLVHDKMMAELRAMYPSLPWP